MSILAVGALPDIVLLCQHVVVVVVRLGVHKLDPGFAALWGLTAWAFFLRLQRLLQRR